MANIHIISWIQHRKSTSITVSTESDCNNSYCNNSYMSVYWKLLMVNLSGNFRMPWTKRRGAQDWPNSGSDRPDYHMYCQLELLLLKACQKKDLTSWASCCMYFFKEDLNQDQLQAQLLILTSLIMLHLLWVLQYQKIFSLSNSQRIL